MAKRKKPARKAPVAQRRRPLTIVGIGASAGGLEALSRLFARLRPDIGMAYVVILHLAPDHESNLPEILQRVTPMRVKHAEDGDLVEPNHVYVLPPNRDLSIADGRLALEPRHAAPGRAAMPIDSFLRALADDQKRRSIGIILSGSGHDGTLGVKAVKSEGGLVFAQDAESSAQRSMPQSAETTGAVDFVLSPEDIAAELARVSKHPYLVHGGRAGSPLPDDERSLRRIFAIVRAATGVDFAQYKPTTVGRRLMRRLILHKLERLDQYAELLSKDPAEVRAFYEETLIHVTHFFREPEAFEALQARVLPRLLKNGGKDQPIRVWVPGCSTGEEAYSLAICLLDALGDRANVRPVQIFATDISDAAIDKARLGLYPEGIRNDVPARLLRRFFTKTERGYQVAKIVRDACIFAKQNLAKDPPFANMDLISCRNVLIYLEPSLQKRIMPIFHYALKPSGALMLGSSETVGEFSSLFSVADKQARIYYKKAGAHAMPRFDVAGQQPFEPHELAPKQLKSSAPSTLPTGWPESDVQKAADRLLLSRFSPAGVIVNGDLEILQFRGPINRFLRPATGKASLSLLKMLPDECHAVLHSLIQRSRKSESAVRQAGLVLEDAAERRQNVAIEVVPLQGPVSGERCFIVLFELEEEARGRGKKGKAPPPVKTVAEDRSSDRLRKELSSTKDYLQAIIEDHEASNEELKAANEEIISSNEELQSTNEELETAKEELQAANEELTTLNEELQTRNTDLNVVNNDLVNLLASVHLPIIMLGSDLRIRRFTPLAEKVMNLIPGDVGRPISDIKPKIEVPDLEQLVTEVIESVATREVEVRDKEGRWISLRIRPYKTTENKIDGAVLVLVDIDAVKKTMLELRENTLFAEAIFDMVGEGLVTVGADLTIKTANHSFARACEAGRTVLGRPLFEVAGGRWDEPALRQAVEKLHREGQPFAGLRVGGARAAHVSGRRLTDGPEGATLLLAFAFHKA